MTEHTPIAEQKRLVAHWWRTDQSKSAFARSIGVHPSTFGSWPRHHSAQDDVDPPGPTVFFDVTPEPVSTVLPEPNPTSLPEFTPTVLSVRWGAPGGPSCGLEFDVMPPPAWFAAVLRQVASC